jgi:MraZ protein
MTGLLLTGEFEHTLDKKNRLFISNKLRNQIDVKEYGCDFYLALGPNGILCLYAEKYFQQLALTGVPGSIAPDEAVSFERLTFGRAVKLEIDRQGRLLLPEKIKKRANLGSELILVGVRDHIEIWNAGDWEQYMTENRDLYQNQITQARQTVLQKQSRQVEL